MILFHCDLDNTLIYSYKQEIGGDALPVEDYQGRQISFMTPTTQKNLRKIREKVTFVPTTTRSLSQYQRINLEHTPKYALVANGGVLLVDGEADSAWYQQSQAEIAPALAELRRGEGVLQQDSWVNFEVRWVEDLFLFTKSEKPEETAENLRKNVDNTLVEVHTNGVKVYLLPKSMTKGRCVERMRAKLAPDFVVSAGDSLFDCPMLSEADLGYAPFSLRNHRSEGGNWGISPENVLFSDWFTQDFLENLNQGTLGT